MTLTVLDTLIRPFGKPFKVSGKGQTRKKLTYNAAVGNPLLILLGLFASAVAYAIVNAAWFPSHSLFVLALGWSAYSMTLLWLAFQASLDVPQSSNILRFHCDVQSVIRGDNVANDVTVHSLSDADAEISVGDACSVLSSMPLSLVLPIEGMTPLKIAAVEPVSSTRLRLTWERPDLDQHRRLISFLYGRPGQWEKRGVPEYLTFWHFLHAPFRMFPLAEGVERTP